MPRHRANPEVQQYRLLAVRDLKGTPRDLALLRNGDRITLDRSIASIMSVSKEESLSADDVRQKLYQTFKSRGLLDSLKVCVQSVSLINYI